MAQDLYLGVDCGTQGTKAVVFTHEGNALGRGYAKHKLIERANGAREQEPAWWVAAMIAAIRESLRPLDAAASVRALGVSGQQHGLVVLDEAMRVIRPAKLWNDTETAPQNASLIASLGGVDACFASSGVIPLTGYTVSKLVWLRDKEPECFARIRHILLPHEYLNWWLTGLLAAEPGDASGTGFFDVRTRRWDHRVLDAIDGGTGQLASALPPLIASDALVGTVRPEAADTLGLSTACVVSAGGGDNMMGALGTGNVREGVVTLSLGTSSTVYSFRNQVILDPTGNVAPFCASGSWSGADSGGGWLPLVCTMNATNVVTQTLAMLGRTVASIESALHTTAPGADGLVMLPFLNGERTPNLPEARGTLVGLSATNWRTENLIRAAIEGTSFGILAGLDRILGGEQAQQIVLIGGGARSPGWRQLLADATGSSVVVPEEDEAGCLGAAIQAMHALRTTSNDSENIESITARCVRFDLNGTATPRSDMRAPYMTARERYRTEFGRLYASDAQ